MILKVPFKQQSQPNTCGAACLEMVLKYYDFNVSESKIFQKISSKAPQTGRLYIGTSNLIKFVSENGFDLQYNIKNIVNLKPYLKNRFPVIVLQRHTVTDEFFAHFRVVVGFKHKSYIVHDPEKETGANKLIYNTILKELWKKQPNGENESDNVFILIKPKNIN